MTAAELQAALADNGWSRRQLASRLGMHDSTVDLWASGKRPIARRRLDDVRAALDGTLDQRREPMVAFGPPEPLPPKGPEWVGTCSEDCHCARFRCRSCGVFWAGAAGEHRCEGAA